jgi:AcrR family transcriptional regulator
MMEAMASLQTPLHLRPRRQPLQARARRRVDAILEATSELLTEDGVEALSTATIAKRAGVPIGSVYHYFPTKEAVLVELAERKLRAVDENFVERIGPDLERLPWRRALMQAVDGSVVAFHDDPVFVAVWRAMRGSAAFRFVAAASDERFARALLALPIIARMSERRALRLMRTVIRVANSFLDWSLETTDRREATVIVREMKKALLAYLGPELDRPRAPRRRPRRSAHR